LLHFQTGRLSSKLFPQSLDLIEKFIVRVFLLPAR